jgi:hypothetical protein
MKTKNKWILVGVVVLFVSAGFTVRSMNSVKSMMYWAKVIKLQEAELRPINFVGRVIDQNGDPVVNAKAAVVISGNYFASGDAGNGMVATNSDGYFVINNLKGVSLGIYDFEKYGYQINTKTKIGGPPGEEEAANPHFYDFKEHSNALLWSDYTHEHPYVIKAWKVSKYSEVNTLKNGDHKIYKFIPNGKDHVINLLSPSESGLDGTTGSHLITSVKAIDTEWNFRVAAVNGGVQEALDSYTNVAPEEGYKDHIEYSFKTVNKNSVQNELEKTYYFKSGKTYGVVTLLVRPYHRDEASIRTDHYVINLEGGRELAVKPKE